jgi:hypothetical protein
MNRRPSLVLALSMVTLASCASLWPQVHTERRPDGIIHLTCKMTLQRCLDQAEAACEHQRYAVIRAFDDHEYKGNSIAWTEVRNSEAWIRCGFGHTFGAEAPELRDAAVCPPPAPAPPPPAPAPAPTCTQGASVACVGVGGCRGGQICLEGGKLGPCDCGPAAPPPPATPAR